MDALGSEPQIGGAGRTAALGRPGWGEGREVREAADYSNYEKDARNYSNYGKDARNHSDYGFVTPDYSNYGKVT